MNRRLEKAKTPPRALYHVYQKLTHLREIIAENHYPSAAELAVKMEVSLRTVKRYLDNLPECGAPLRNDRRRGGYYYNGSCPQKAIYWHSLSPSKHQNLPDKSVKPHSFANP